MDATDFRLLATLHEDAFRSQAQLARVLGVSPATVTRRLAKLREQGVLAGWWTHVAARAVGRAGTIHAFVGGDLAPREARAALAAEDVAWVSLKHNGDLAAAVYAEGGRARGSEELSKALGLRPSWTLREELGAKVTLTPLQARLVVGLLRAPHSSPEALARQTRLSPKTVRRHLRGLRAEGAIDVQPILGPSTGMGVVAFHLAVFGPRLPADLPRKASLDDAVVIERLEDALYLLAQAPDLAGVEAALQRTRALSGVRDARVTLHREMLVATDRIAEWVTRSARPASTTASRSRRA